MNKVKVTANIGKAQYKTEIRTDSGNKIIADEPENDGGKNLGFAATELLAAALSACTCVTVRMYADRKKWDLASITADVALERNHKTNRTYILCKLKFTGTLTQQQTERLMQIATICPIHKTLTNPVEIKTELK